jgi:hypothetical protein
MRVWLVVENERAGCCGGRGTVHVNVQYRGFTALMGAARNGHTDCVRLLVDGGADKKLKDEVRNMRWFPFCSKLIISANIARIYFKFEHYIF